MPSARDSVPTLVRLGGVAAAAGGALQAARVVVGSLSPDPDYWDCNSASDYAQNALDGVGFALLALGFLAVRARQGAASGGLGSAAALSGAAGSIAIAISNPLEHCVGAPAIGFVAGVVLLTLGTLALGVSTLRGRVLPRWCGIALVAAAIAPLPLQEGGVLLAGLMWVSVGLAVAYARR